MVPLLSAVTLLTRFGWWPISVTGAALALVSAWWCLVRAWRSIRPWSVVPAPAAARSKVATAEPAPSTSLAMIGPYPGGVADDIVERLQNEVVTMVRASLHHDPIRLLPQITATTNTILTLLERRQLKTQTNELRLLAAMTLGVAADNDLNLGNRASAMSNVRLARAYAEMASHGPLQAWCCAVQSWVLAHEGRTREAALLALSGQQFATTPAVARRLHGMHGTALALTGDRRGAIRAFELARTPSSREADDRIGVVERAGGIFDAPIAKQYQNAAYGLTRLGLFSKASNAAAKAVYLYTHGPAGQRDYVLEAGARINLAISYVMHRQLDASRAALRPALELPPNCRVDYIRSLMGDMRKVLGMRRFDRSREAMVLSSEIDHFMRDRPTVRADR
jgi:tetratricopeptide (TPR) repeat protein